MMAQLRRFGSAFCTACRALDRWRGASLLVTGLALASLSLVNLSQSPRRSLTRQLEHLNPDAALYWGLARNLLKGVGYYDTIREREVLPSVGHPGLLAVAWSNFGWTPAQFTQMTVWLATALTIWAVYRYTRSAAMALLCFVLTAAWMPHIRWLVGNVESTTVLATAVLIAALAEFYRRGRWWPWGAIVGLALALHLLARPVLLYPSHAVVLGVLSILALPAWRRRVLGALRSRRRPAAAALVLAVFVAEAVIAGVRIQSEYSYGDSRLVTGTYGAWPLLGGNSMEQPPAAPYSRKPHSERWVEHAKLMMRSYGEPERKLGWEERQRLFLSEVIAYWRSHPLRALRGYEWRLRRLLGFNEDAFASPLGAAHALLTASLLGLAVLNVRRRSTRWGLTTVVTGIALLYAGIHALFLWAQIRYAVPLFPLLTVGVTIGLYEALYGNRLRVARGVVLRRSISRVPGWRVWRWSVQRPAA